MYCLQLYILYGHDQAVVEINLLHTEKCNAGKWKSKKKVMSRRCLYTVICNDMNDSHTPTDGISITHCQQLLSEVLHVEYSDVA